MDSLPQGFEVLYDHCGIVVINKAFSIPSQPNRRGDLDVYTQLTQRYDYVGQHHRLDQPASGLLLFTTDRSHNIAISKAFNNHDIERSYWIWVVGETKATGPWKQQLDGKRAHTDFTLIEHKGGMSRLNVSLQTGRTHQIRRHAQMNNCPIIGDRKYGGAAKRLWTRLALHAHKLEFVHPETDDVVIVQSPLPQDLQGIF